MEAIPFRIFQVELTSYCNMKCGYCPHPRMKRPKGHMTEKTLTRCIDIAKKASQQGLTLHHFGEPLLHPRLEQRLKLMAEAGLSIHFSSNGLLLEKKLPLLRRIATPISVTLSVHQWAESAPDYFRALEEWQQTCQGTNITVHRAPNAGDNGLGFHTWADGKQRAIDLNKCYFLKANSGVILWDGRIVSCCLDCHGECVIGNIHDSPLETLETVPWRGCRVCVFN